MKNLNKIAIISGLLVAAGITHSSNAGQSCTTCGGYFYTAVSYTNNYGITNSHFMSVGPFADPDSCNQAVFNDYGNNDGWLPYEGSPQCILVYESDYEAHEEIIDDWNNGSDKPSNPGVIADEAVLAKIAELREVYNLKEYEAQLGILITDPNRDEDEDNHVKR